MSGIQRYDRTSLSMWPSEDGLYVRYSDHEAEVARMRAEVEGLRSEIYGLRLILALVDMGDDA